VFSIVVYANMQGIFSSRAIEEACKTDIRFMWLLQIRLDFATAPFLFFIKNL
jgi:transposase